jgi:PAS domain S-box-containing protein
MNKVVAIEDNPESMRLSTGDHNWVERVIMQSVNGPFLVCIMFSRYFSAVFIQIIARAKLSSIAGVIALFCFMNVFAAIAADNPKVLVLHSYHSGFQWTDDQNSAIIKSLQSAYPKGDVFVEYMNTKRVALEVMSPMLRQNYAILYRNVRLNLIIATDNNALDFLLKYGDELFPGVPVVFCGINNFDDYNLSDHRNYTGVREDFDTGATLDIALRFHPDTHTVAMIADVTESSQITLAIARKVVKAKKYGKIRFVELSGLSETALAEKLSKLEKGTIILLLSYYRSPEGRVFTVKDGMQLIQEHTQLPVYALWDFYMLPPAIGGKIVTGTLQGKAAAEIAIRILKGEKPEAIPPYSCPTAYYFNYDALQKYNIPASLIPADSIIAGKPDTIYSRYKTYIWIGAAFALSLIATILILLRSIVLQHRNEAALRASEEKFRVLFENAIEGIYQTSLDGRLLSANPAMAHILAFASPDELKATLTNVWQQLYVHPEDRDIFLSAILAQGTVNGLEFQFRQKDKQTIWVSINARLVRDDAGAPLFVEGFITDITERKRAEKALKMSEERFRRLAENARDTIYRMSLPDGAYEYMSPAAIELTGYAPEEFYRNPQLLREFIHPEWRPYIEEEWSRLLKGEMPPTYEFQIIHRSGDVRWVNQRNIMVRDEEGRPVAIEGIVTDITERKRSEEELCRLNEKLRSLNEELEQRVKERTAELEVKNAELYKMNRLFVGRELRMVELKEKIRELERKSAQKDS